MAVAFGRRPLLLGEERVLLCFPALLRREGYGRIIGGDNFWFIEQRRLYKNKKTYMDVIVNNCKRIRALAMRK